MCGLRELIAAGLGILIAIAVGTAVGGGIIDAGLFAGGWQPFFALVAGVSASFLVIIGVVVVHDRFF